MAKIALEDETLDARDGPTSLLLCAEYWKRECLRTRAQLAAANEVEYQRGYADAMRIAADHVRRLGEVLDGKRPSKPQV